MMQQQATRFGRVAVLMGGRSAEREISLRSGKAVLRALKELNVDAHGVDVGTDVAQQLLTGRFDRAFIVLHGRGGEDGEIQGLLRSMGLPYTGSDISAAVLSMNKRLSKYVWMQQGLPTPDFEQILADTDPDYLIEKMGLPLVVKPVNEGSSIGMSKVNNRADLHEAIVEAARFDADLIAEQWVDGAEYTVSILANEALPVFRLQTPREFYDFEAKYQANTTEYLCPCGLDAQAEAECKRLALHAFNALGMKGWGRVDVMRHHNGQFYLLEANSVPGMTDHSLVPMAAKAAGVDFGTLCLSILQTTLEEDG